MTTLMKGMLAASLLLSTPALAEEAHHTPSATAGDSAADIVPLPSTTNTIPGGDATGMMGADMMKMMKDMMTSHAERMQGMMSEEGRADGAPMREMMSPEHMEGRIAFLRTELKITEAQQPLWEAVAEVLRANSAASKGMPPAMMGGITQPDASLRPLPQRLSDMERMLSARLDGLHRLNAALEPFYASLGETQKATADDLLIPMGVM